MHWPRLWLVRRMRPFSLPMLRLWLQGGFPPRVTNEGVQKAAAALKGSDHRRATNVSARLDAQLDFHQDF